MPPKWVKSNKWREKREPESVLTIASYACSDLEKSGILDPEEHPALFAGPKTGGASKPHGPVFKIT